MTEFIVQLQWLHTSIYHITFVPVTCGMKGIPFEHTLHDSNMLQRLDGCIDTFDLQSIHFTFPWADKILL